MATMMHATPATFPLKDVTLSRLSTANRVPSAKPTLDAQVSIATAARTPTPTKPAARVYRHDPYNWEWRVDEAKFAAFAQAEAAELSPMASFAMAMQVEQSPVTSVGSPTMSIGMPMSPMSGASPLALSPLTPVQQTEEPATFEPTPLMCRALVQFKCHHGEFSSSFELRKGQYVVVQGDRGHDVGVVIRINTDEAQQYVERTGPSGPILRHATQREVDYWATDLKADEVAALEYCRQRVVKHRLQMDVRHAEYQFDKKKLTFYYEAKARVDFVTLLKELFREFSCRIWMEKVRTHE